MSWTGHGASVAGPSVFTALPATVTPGSAVVNVSQWNRAGSVAYNAAGGTYNSNTWLVGGSFAAAQAANAYVYFTITNDAATELHVTELFVMSQVSATGPQNVRVQYAVGSGADNNFGTAVPTAHSASPENWLFTGNMCVAAGQTVTFKLYGWGATGTAGTLRINNGTYITAGFAPTVTAIAANSSPVCTGNLLNFTGTPAGGIPGYTYSWSGPASFSSALQNPSIASPGVSAAGVYTLTVTDALNCASIAATTTVTINTSPAAITGTMIVCPLLTTTLSSASAGGSWSSSNTSIATVGATSGIVTGVAPGTATVTYALGSSCIATAIVTVSTPPTAITGTLAVCEGLTTTLTNATTGGTWSSGSPANGTISTGGVVTGIAAGTTAITYTVAGGCIAVADVTVNAFPPAITGTPIVCVGQTTTLNNATTGGTWSSSAPATGTVTATTGIVTGIAAGTTVVSYSLAGGCYVTTVTTVNPLPATIAGTASVCAGFTRTLTDATTGGGWTSSNTGIATVGATSGIVTGVSAGTVTITYTLPTSCYRTITFTVNATPAIISGPAGVCLGLTVTLNDATTGGTWSSTNTTNATIGSLTGIVSGLAVGTTTISYVLTATGCYTTRTESVNPLPAGITGPGTVCPGTSITLANTSTGGTWSSSNTGIATAAAATGVITGVAAGTATITYTLPTTCITTTIITVNPAPPAVITPIGDTTFCPGGFVALTSNTGTGYTYSWFVSGAPIPGITASTYIANTGGDYQVRIVNTLGCATFSIPMTVLVDAVTAAITVPGGTTTGCDATGIVLNANTGTGLSYQWIVDGSAIPGAVGASYTALTGGNYSVLVSNTTGCSDVSAPVAITIIASPAATLSVSGPLSFCMGDHVTLSGAAGTGYTYQWNNAAGPIAGATNMNYNATATGTYWVTVNNGPSCNTNSGVANVTVNPLPSVAIILSGPRVFCSGGSVTMTATTGGYTYQWYRGGIAIPGANAATYVATLAGGYRVSVTNTTTGCTDTTHADTVVTLITTPSIVPLTATTFCWGGNALLSTSVSGAGALIGYQWLLNGVVIPGANAPTYIAETTGIYSCTISVPASCTLTSTTITITERPLPNPVVTFDGASFHTASYYISYQWYKDLIAIPGATTATTHATGNGAYKVDVVDSNGCHSFSAAYILTGHAGGSTGVANAAEAEQPVRIYPNPAKDLLFIESDSDVRIIITGMDGTKLIDRAHATMVNTSMLAAGVYLVKVYNSEGQVILVEKLVKTAF